MDQDDKILQISLKTVGISIEDFDGLSSQQLIGGVVGALRKFMVTAPSDKSNFIDQKVLENALKLTPSSSRPQLVKTCTILVDYLTKLEFRQSLGFNNFLYPDGKTVRKIFTFLAESIAKYQEKDTVKTAQLSVFQLGVLKAMRQWMSRPWLLPEFVGPSKHPVPKGGSLIAPDPAWKDYAKQPPRVRTAKIKRVFQVLNGAAFKEFGVRDAYARGGLNLQSVQELNEVKKQRVTRRAEGEEGGLLNQEEDEDDEEAREKRQKIKKNLAKALAALLAKKKGAGEGAASALVDDPQDSGDMAGRQRANSLGEIFSRRREEEQKVQAIQEVEEASTFEQKIQFESQDIAGALHGADEDAEDSAAAEKKKKRGGGGGLGEGGHGRDEESSEQSGAQTAASGGAEGASAESAFEKKQKQRRAEIAERLEKLKEEKEGEVEELQARLSKMQEKLAGLETKIAQKENENTEIGEQLPELENQYREIKRRTETKHALLKAVEKGGDAMGAQQAKVNELESELASLQKQWDEYKKPLVEEIQETQEEVKEKRVEYQFKKEQVLQMRADISRATKEMAYKEELMQFMQEQYAKAPKDLTRNTYTVKINSIIGQLKTQEKQIAGTVEDIRDLQGKTGHLVHAVKLLDEQLEDLIFQQAKKESVSKAIYKDILAFKQVFDVLVTALQQQVNVKNSVRDVEKKTQDMRLKLKELNIDGLENDIRSVQKENEALARKVKK